MRLSDVLKELQLKQGDSITFFDSSGEIVTLDNAITTGHKMDLNSNGMININQLGNSSHPIAVDTWTILKFNQQKVYI